MKATERREEIIKKLTGADEEISAGALATELGVSRQIIVGDVAILRAGGTDIVSTPKGYVLKTGEKEQGKIIRQVACVHTASQMEEELGICLDQGCDVLDVIVEHPIYGQLVAQLQLHSRYDLKQFIRKTKEADAHPLSEITGGVHLHTLACPSQAAFERTCQELREAGFLYENQQEE